MTHENIARPLADALQSKGYDALTPVQSAVLADEAVGRDMLVSAQTGSGKTVAFGLAIAPEILAGQDRLDPADRPLALAIAPTRELALQVARELAWLYGTAEARIATCVGGMDYRNERRALERGAHIVVGTPGRLRDHIERGSLDLSGLGAAILDEADEMLDLGFREDLEFILGAAPAERRTLMFSATVPPAIEKLARDFQNDALRVVARGEARQHGDIAYQALTVAVRDREPAIFNMLRFHEAQTAIVFCKTRANVNHLLARMSNRGFRAVALSGELSQQERSHALQALRDGRARVCIATDVAARGIDLPGLELVIHADLPTNSETLLHRSGRTGRAGAKGISALIVVPAEVKKAQRLLAGAKVQAEWNAAPSADDVRARDDLRMVDHPALQPSDEDEPDLAATLLERFGAATVAQAFIRLWREGRPAPDEIIAPTAPGAVPAPHTPRERPPFGDSVWFEMSKGHQDRAEARWLLPKICEAGGITRDAIGAIRVREAVTYVQISIEMAARFGADQTLEPGLSMTRMADAPDLDRPQRAAPVRTERARPAENRPAESRHTENRPAETRPAEPRAARTRPAEDRAAPRTDTADATSRDDAASSAAGYVADPAPKPKKARWTSLDRDQRDPGTQHPPASDRAATDRSRPAKPFGAKPYAGKPLAEHDGAVKPFGGKPGGGKASAGKSAKSGANAGQAKTAGGKPIPGKPGGKAFVGGKPFGGGKAGKPARTGRTAGAGWTKPAKSGPR